MAEQNNETAEGSDLLDLLQQLTEQNEKLREENKRLHRKEEEYKRDIHTLSIDSVTNILKKEGFIKRFKNEEKTVTDVLKGPHAVLVLDLDNFKKVNDTWGHKSGDFYLRNIAYLLDATTWEDVVNLEKKGNEEIGFCFRGKEGDELVAVLEVKDDREESYRQRIEKFKENFEDGLQDLVKVFEDKGIKTKPSVSIGACFEKKGYDFSSVNDDLRKFFNESVDGRADEALFDEKKRKGDKEKLLGLTMFEDLEKLGEGKNV